VHSGSGVVVDEDEKLESQSVLGAAAVTIVAKPIQASQALLEYRWWSRILASNPK
jgi:Zn-dependent membrane protease YugP